MENEWFINFKSQISLSKDLIEQIYHHLNVILELLEPQ